MSYPQRYAAAPANPHGRIRFNNVSFAYNEERPVLTKVEFEARPGELVALLGPTGSGKTSIVNLIPRFYDVSGGSVMLDDDDVRDLTLEGLRSQVAIVQQDVFLFSGTIGENIAYGKLDANEDEIWAAARRAQLDDFIRSQPDGLETVIGELGAW